VNVCVGDRNRRRDLRRCAAMTTSLIEIATPDGPCNTELVVPDGKGPWPAVLVFFDAGGLRAAQTRIAERIAKSGYVVVQPDLFHRAPPISTMLDGEEVTLKGMMKVFHDPELRAKFFGTYYAPATDYENLTKTIGAVLDHVEHRSDVKGGVGTTGYCMGGNVSVRVGTLFGDRIKATAAFHPGGLVTDQPDSPHLRVKSIKARVYLGPAINDLPADAEAKLRSELDAGHVRYQIEHYDANHGYAVDDSEAYNEAAAERHYAALDALFGATLRG
jgi:carboxymethylenebutenolidase